MGSEVRKGAWSEEEDSLLRKCLEKYGEGKWAQVPPRAGLNRCRKSCRLRWLNYLQPGIKRGNFCQDEVDLIVRLHNLLGNRWSLIAGRLHGRTANDVKNYWNTKCKSKHKSHFITIKPTKSIITQPSQVLKPQPRIVIRSNIVTSFNLKDDEPTQIALSNNENDSLKRMPSIENIADDALLSFSSFEHDVTKLFTGLFQNEGHEAGGSWPSQPSVDEGEMINTLMSEELPTYFVEGNNERGDDSNSKDKNKTLIWDNNIDNDTIIDMDIWDLLCY